MATNTAIIATTTSSSIKVNDPIDDKGLVFRLLNSCTFSYHFPSRLPRRPNRACRSRPAGLAPSAFLPQHSMIPPAEGEEGEDTHFPLPYVLRNGVDALRSTGQPFLVLNAKPTKPEPSKSIVAGSGTVVTHSVSVPAVSSIPQLHPVGRLGAA